MKRLRLIFSVLVLSLLGACAPTPELPQFTQDDYFYSELKVPGFPYDFIYLNFVHNFDDGTADGNFTLYRSDAYVLEASNFSSRQLGGRFEIRFDVTPTFDPGNFFGGDSVAATLLVAVEAESLDGVLSVPELRIKSRVSLKGPVSDNALPEVLNTFE